MFYWSILRSILIVVAISSCVSGLWWAAGGQFWQSFIAMSILQITFNIVWEGIRSSRLQIALQQEETKRIEEYSKQGYELKCAYCGQQSFVPIRFDEDNYFECPHCGKENSVYVSITTTQVTSPLPVARIMSNSYIQEAEDVRNG